MTQVHVITAKSPNDGLSDGLWWLKTTGARRDSRNGPVIVAPGPVITTYPRPNQRVMFSALRDANPFFHLYEAIWMLAGRDDSAAVGRYAATMESFAEDGRLWGAYGYRWRHFFGFDQLKEIVKLLRADPTTRRAVLTMWSPDGDLVPTMAEGNSGHGGVYASKDVPCNTQVYFDASRGPLDMTVTNRSNDIVWGCYGANVVHMSMLHEFVARAANLHLGSYHQVSNNFHLYPDRSDTERLIDASYDDGRQWTVLYRPDERYEPPHGPPAQKTYPLMGCQGSEGKHAGWENWLREAETFAADPCAMDGPALYRHDFFANVAIPLMRAHKCYKDGEVQAGINYAQTCMAWDWRDAATEWLIRRRDARMEREQLKDLRGGVAP